DDLVTGVQTCALPICLRRARARAARAARYARPPRYTGSDTVSDALLLMALLAAATARGAAPLVLAALGGLFAERSGIVDIGLEEIGRASCRVKCGWSR